MDLRTELDALTKSLDEAGIPYAVCGALALAIHGHPRATKDIELLTPAEHVVAAKAVARVHGFTIEALPMTFSASGITVHRVSRLVGAQILTIDLSESTGVLAPVWNSRARRDRPRSALGGFASGSRDDEARRRAAAGTRRSGASRGIVVKPPVDMSAAAIEGRLVAASAQSPLSLVASPRVDMSAGAVESRLAEWAELTLTCLELADARR